LDQTLAHESWSRGALQILLERERLVLVQETKGSDALHGQLVAGVMHRTCLMTAQALIQIVRTPNVLVAIGTK
jgi:hypothetical protein